MKKLTTEEWVIKAKETHKDNYSYVDSVYTNRRTKIQITCFTHGNFWQIPSAHVGGQGCQKCADIKRKLAGRATSEEFIEKAKAVHGNKYDYSMVEYITSKHNVLIRCKKHGEFTQSPNAHLSGSGCYLCGLRTTKVKQLLPIDETLKQFYRVHKNTYTYFPKEYTESSHTKIRILCKTHGTFMQTPSLHKQGSGCPKCNTGIGATKHYFSKTTLYYIKIEKDDKTVFKIGITKKPTRLRFKGLLRYITIISEEVFSKGIHAFKKEQRILKQYNKYRYAGPKLFPVGNTEMFTEDVLQISNLKLPLSRTKSK